MNGLYTKKTLLRRVAMLVCLVLTVTGCNTPETSTKPVRQANELIDKMDPTGMRDRNKKISEAAEAIKTGVGDLDVQGVNMAIADLGAFADDLRCQLDMLRQSIAEMLAGEIEKSGLGERSAELGVVLGRLSDKIDEIDVEAANATIRETQQLVDETSEAVKKLSTSLDIEAANAVIEEANRLVADLREATAELPISQSGEAAESLSAATAWIPEAAKAWRVTIWLTNALLVLLILCALIWIFRGRRSAG